MKINIIIADYSNIYSIDRENRRNATANHCAPLSVLKRAMHDSFDDVRSNVAGSFHITVEMLICLSNDEDYAVRSAVAIHPFTPPGTLKKLSEDRDWCVRANVANNINTPANVLKTLINSTKTSSNDSVSNMAWHTLRKLNANAG